MPLFSSPFPTINAHDGVTTLVRYRANSIQRVITAPLNVFRSRSRQNSDWSREDVGDFFVPREEEYSWNDQKRITKPTNGAVGSMESYEDDDTEEDEDEEEEEQYKLTRRFTEGELDRFVAMKEQLWRRRWRRKGGGVEGAWWLDPSLLLCRAWSMSSCDISLPAVEGPISVHSSEEAAPPLIEDSDVTRRSSSTVTLSAAEEKVFFEKIKKSMPKTQRCISDEILRKLDRERKGCACKCCEEWNELRLEVRKGSWIKQRWKGRVLRSAKRLVGREHVRG